jgi:hypothetical protein
MSLDHAYKYYTIKTQKQIIYDTESIVVMVLQTVLII